MASCVSHAALLARHNAFTVPYVAITKEYGQGARQCISSPFCIRSHWLLLCLYRGFDASVPIQAQTPVAIRQPVTMSTAPTPVPAATPLPHLGGPLTPFPAPAEPRNDDEVSEQWSRGMCMLHDESLAQVAHLIVCLLHDHAGVGLVLWNATITHGRQQYAMLSSEFNSHLCGCRMDRAVGNTSLLFECT